MQHTGLIEQIKLAFNEVEYPGDWCLANSTDGDEPVVLAEVFKGKTNRYEISPTLLDTAPKNLSSALSFFSDEAFRFYLPAYLIADINGKLERADVIFHLTHGFSDSGKDKKINPKRFGERAWFDYVQYKLSVFSTRQIAAIIAYLSYKLDNSNYRDFEKEPIIQALVHYKLLLSPTKSSTKNNIHLSGKFLSHALEAIDFRIDAYKKQMANPKISEEELASLDYGNDLQVYEVLKETFEAEKLKGSAFLDYETPLEIEKYKAIQEGWNTERQIAFALEIAVRITIAVRDVWADDKTPDNIKLETIKHFNEFQHSVLNYLRGLEGKRADQSQYAFFLGAFIDLDNNERTKGYIQYLLIDSFEKINALPKKTFSDFTNQFLVYHQALNEVCHGAYALPEWEFSTLMGVSKPEAVKLLNAEKDLWGNIYGITELDNCISLYSKSQPPDNANEKTLLTFFADSYNDAMAIRNKFLGFEPYLPMPENIVATRQLAITDSQNAQTGKAEIIIYQPQEMLYGEWKCSFQITGIGNDSIYGICGVDGFQAIELAYKMVGNQLDIFRRDNPSKKIEL